MTIASLLDSSRRLTRSAGLWLVCVLGILAPHAALAANPQADAQTVVHMLDYVGVDYPEFVQDGKVLDEAEYAEQQEFVRQSAKLLAQIASTPVQQALAPEAAALLAKVDAKAPGAEVSAGANALRLAVIDAYSLTVAPKRAPDLKKGAALFAQQCAMCHGAAGRGDGPAGQGLEPAPSDFHDRPRMDARSLYGLYNTISLGVGGTGMRGYAELSEADRWALAFFVANLGTDAAVLQKGEAIWKGGQAAPATLKDLVTATPGEVRAAQGDDGVALQAYLWAHPDALQKSAPAPLAYSREQLQAALIAYANGDRDAARRAAVTAYLEGFELVESSLDNIDPALRTEIERQMMDLRNAIAEGVPNAALEEKVASVEALLDAAEAKLGGGDLSPTTAFVTSLLILLREGLEAILVLAGIIAFVKKTGRQDVMPYIHAGWIAAVALGGVTWVVASYFTTISGANRELTEGVTALIAAAMLLYVGYWLHSKANAQAWQSFIKEQVGGALEKRTVWAMATVSFLAVYREIFEVVLFYQALWVQAGETGRTPVLGGIVVAAAALAVIGWAIFRYSVRLPIGPFFKVTSLLLVGLAIVFAGNGVKALQEAGVIGSTAVQFFTVPLLGIYPSLQSLGAQLLALALVLVGWRGTRNQPKLA